MKREAEALKNHPDLIKLKIAEKWNGELPKISSGETMLPMINLSEENK